MKEFQSMEEKMAFLRSCKKKGKKHSTKSLKISEAQLKIGVKIEREHTKSSKIARKIALDHLNENPKYYIELKKAGL